MGYVHNTHLVYYYWKSTHLYREFAQWTKIKIPAVFMQHPAYAYIQLYDDTNFYILNNFEPKSRWLFVNSIHTQKKDKQDIHTQKDEFFCSFRFFDLFYRANRHCGHLNDIHHRNFFFITITLSPQPKTK